MCGQLFFTETNPPEISQKVIMYLGPQDWSNILRLSRSTKRYIQPIVNDVARMHTYIEHVADGVRVFPFSHDNASKMPTHHITVVSHRLASDGDGGELPLSEAEAETVGATKDRLFRILKGLVAPGTVKIVTFDTRTEHFKGGLESQVLEMIKDVPEILTIFRPEKHTRQAQYTVYRSRTSVVVPASVPQGDTLAVPDAVSYTYTIGRCPNASRRLMTPLSETATMILATATDSDRCLWIDPDACGAGAWARLPSVSTEELVSDRVTASLMRLWDGQGQEDADVHAQNRVTNVLRFATPSPYSTENPDLSYHVRSRELLARALDSDDQLF